MKRVMLGILAILMVVGLSGCGDSTVAVAPPSITSYQFTKDALHEYINGSVDYYAPDSDIDSMTVVVYDSRGREWSRTNTLISHPGITQGTIPFSIDYVTFPSDAYAYTFSIYLTDFNGYTSNQAVDSFYIP
ncbi:MAG: hypothetical protein A2076_08745 [Geobacteraceae bacterium GWC2_53_11]|nr:MAG: hypothetical protein A2076_08745 [Geobacteraceae bacterium GWC2_53_11]